MSCDGFSDFFKGNVVTDKSSKKQNRVRDALIASKLDQNRNNLSTSNEFQPPNDGRNGRDIDYSKQSQRKLSSYERRAPDNHNQSSGMRVPGLRDIVSGIFI